MRFFCSIGLHRDEIAEEFPSDVTTILGLMCARCGRSRCTINARVPRYPSNLYEQSVASAREWLERQTGARVPTPFVTFR